MPEDARAAVSIRRARPQDVAALVAVGTATYRQHFADLWTPLGLEEFLARQFDAGRLALELAGDDVRYDFLFADGCLAGFSKLIRDQRVPLRPDERGMELQKIYFHRGATRRGHGGALIEHLVGVALDARSPGIWLNVLKQNADAVRFYARHGFDHLGEYEFETDRGPATMCAMRRTLARTGPAQSRSYL